MIESVAYHMIIFCICRRDEVVLLTTSSFRLGLVLYPSVRQSHLNVV